MPLLHDFRCLDHGIHVLTVDLYSYRALLVVEGHLAECGFDAAYDGIGRHEFRVDHCGAVALAEHSEANVGYVLHGSEEKGLLAEVYITYFHSDCKVTKFFSLYPTIGFIFLSEGIFDSRRAGLKLPALEKSKRPTTGFHTSCRPSLSIYR